MPGVKCFDNLVKKTLQKDPYVKRKLAIIHNLHEKTRKILHYYKRDFLNELSGLVDFTLVLNLTPTQKQEAEIEKITNKKFKMFSIGSVL